MTPRQFVLLRERHNEQIDGKRKHQELLFGISTATLANHSMAPPKEPYKAVDFMPSELRNKAASDAKAKRWNNRSRAQLAKKLANLSKTTDGLFREVKVPAPQQ